MPQSRPLLRNPWFVFGPPVVLAGLGMSLVLQPQAFDPTHEIIRGAITDFESRSESAQSPDINEFEFVKLATNFASSEWVVVNKQRPLNPIDYEPANLRAVQSSKSLDNSRGLELSNHAATALESLATEMHAQGVGQLFVNSAYRSYEYQSELFVSKTEQYGLAGALVRSAKAGHSEHQTGLAVDVSVPAQGCAIMQCFGDTDAGKWLAENSWKHGFIIRYEEDTTSITGYTYEPWHLRFVGKEIAALYAKNGIQTFEEFWDLPAAEFYLEEITESTSD